MTFPRETFSRGHGNQLNFCTDKIDFFSLSLSYLLISEALFTVLDEGLKV